ncbi:B3 domain-containing protein VP1-like [Zingiber officinale]|uniref:B3 domain-containing protein VP1-like n=1 Tax=Zingiber officinale TaxID=94328 RepID=UPI001C4BF66F|nr:B3 domain-containing protein VP1-like [Zingiber officinale]
MEGELMGEVEANFDDGNLVVDMDAGDDFFFSEDAFASIPTDFSCFSMLPPQPPTETFSPSTTTFKPKGSILSSSSSTASSSSSTSWSSLLQAPEVAAAAASDNAAMVGPASFLDLPQGEISDDMSFFTNFEGLFDLEDSRPDLHGSASGGGDVAGACCGGPQEAGGEGEEKGKEAGGFSDELAKVFFEWLRSNKESISPEDLRSIRLNRSTIESAARRLGRNKQGRIQLLKLILAWVQHNHLRRNPLHPLAPPPHPPLVDYQPMQSPPYTHQLDYNYGSNWFPGADMMAYGGDMFSGATAPYPYHHYSGGGGHLAGPVLSQFAPFPGAAMVGAFPPMFLQGQGVLDGGTTTGVSKTEEARRKRMARQQRRLSSLHHYHHHQRHHRGQRQHAQRSPEVSAAGASSNPSTARNWDFRTNMTKTRSTSSNTQLMQSLIGDQAPPPPKKTPQADGAVSNSLMRPGLKGEKNLKFLLQKVLKQSDVGSLGRIVLPKKEAEMHLPELDARDGISIAMEDIGTSQVWNMRYRFWPNNKSRMYLLENTGDFVRCNGLQEGDFIVIYSDVKSGKYLIRGVKVRQSLEPSRPSVKAGQQHERS